MHVQLVKNAAVKVSLQQLLKGSSSQKSNTHILPCRCSAICVNCCLEYYGTRWQFTCAAKTHLRNRNHDLNIIPRACCRQFHVGTIFFLCHHIEGCIHLLMDRRLSDSASVEAKPGFPCVHAVLHCGLVKRNGFSIWVLTTRSVEFLKCRILSNKKAAVSIIFLQLVSTTHTKTILMHKKDYS